MKNRAISNAVQSRSIVFFFILSGYLKSDVQYVKHLL